MAHPGIGLNITVDIDQFTSSMRDARAEILAAETGLPAATWREALDLAGDDRELFDAALRTWRENFTDTAVDPRTIVTALKDARA